MTVLAREVEVCGAVFQSHRDGLGQATGGVDRAVEHGGDRASAGLAEQPALNDRGHPVGERREAHNAAVGEHDDGARVDREHGVEQGELGGRKLEVVAVEALRLLGGGDPEEEHGDVGGGCRGDGLGALCWAVADPSSS